MDYLARIKVLEDEIAHKDEIISQLRSEMGLDIHSPPCLNLTQREAVIFCVLVKRSIALKAQLYAALYSLGDNEIEPKIVDVFVCKMRKKLKRFDIHIDTVWGQGYKLGEDSRRAAQELIASSQQTVYNNLPAKEEKNA